MTMKAMKTLTFNTSGNTYEITDEYARGEITAIKNNAIKEFSTTLLATNWSGDTAPYTYDVTISDHSNITDIVDLTAGNTMTTEQLLELQRANIVRAEWTSATTLTLYAYNSKPEIDAPIKIFLNSTFK